MKKKIMIISAAVLVLIAAVSAFAFSSLTNNKADTVIYGSIYTGVDGLNTSEAIAIKDGTIIYVGNKAGVEKYINEQTEILDHSNDFILSGFSDTHTHITPYVGANEYQMVLSNATTIEQYVKIIRDYVKEHPDYEMYIGRGYNYMLFENGAPTKDILDQISTDKPIYIKSEDGHACWVNSKMLELINVNKDTEEVIGGEIVRDQDGNPSGCFRDAAMDVYVKPNVVPFTVEEYKGLILKGQEYYASLGYTALVEVFVEPDNANYNLFKAYEELDKEGKLLLRTQGAWNLSNSDDYKEKLEKLIEYKNESKGGMFELTDVKIFMDGVAETKTAYFSEPYNDDSSNYGADRWPGEDGFNKLVDIVTTANKNDMVAHFHAIGDAAITKALDAIEKSRESYVNPKIHNVITHLEVVKESDFERFKKLDVVVAANLAWGCMFGEAYNNVEVKHLGEERAFHAYPYKTVLNTGAVVSSATDYPAGTIVSPMIAYVIGVTRNATTDEAFVRDATQKMTIEEALKVLTYNGAYQMRQENYRGTLEVGKKADLVIYNTSLIDNFSLEKVNAEVLLSMVDGKIVYEVEKSE